MFVISSPKSASTSLGLALGNLLNKENHQFFTTYDSSNKFYRLYRRLKASINASPTFMSDVFPSFDFPLMSRFHADIADFFGSEAKSSFSKLYSSDCVYKQHFPPTPSNIDLVFRHKSVLLISSPEEIVNSYLRVPDANRSITSTYLARLLQHSSACRQSLYNELDKWNKGWLESFPADQVIFKNDLISHPDISINKVLKYLEVDCTVDSSFELPRLRVYC